jgi:ABC-type uncharacterized transport system substrate-binding protein
MKTLVRIRFFGPQSANLKSKIKNRKLVGIAVIVVALTVCGARVEAQQPAKIPRVGFLSGAPRSANPPWREALRQGLRELGYEEGKNIVIEWRYAEEKPDRTPKFAAELVRLKVDVIVAVGPGDTGVARAATTVTPIVTILAGDPGYGFVASLARPGGNVTGFAILRPELTGKRLELLKEILPKLSRVAVFADSTARDYPKIQKELEPAARVLGVKLQSLDILSPKDFETAFQTAVKERADAVLVRVSGPILSPHRTNVAALAVKSRLPVMYERAAEVDAGGLMSYGVSIPDLFRRAATYVDKILKGAKPADLPVEQPTKFEFIINLKAAKQIGLTIPPNVLARADRVIR